jgi:fumarate reductase subunit D
VTFGDVAVWIVFLAGAMVGALVLALVAFILGAMSLNRDER